MTVTKLPAVLNALRKRTLPPSPSGARPAEFKPILPLLAYLETTNM
jgi:hypothetical protein